MMHEARTIFACAGLLFLLIVARARGRWTPGLGKGRCGSSEKFLSGPMKAEESEDHVTLITQTIVCRRRVLILLLMPSIRRC